MQRKHRVLLPALMVLALAMFASAILGQPNAAAATKCDPGGSSDNNHRWAGMRRSATNGGVYAQLENYSPWVDPGHVPTVAYVSVAGSTDPSWAQVGWLEGPYGDRHTFLQVQTGLFSNTSRLYSDPPYPEGSYIYYAVLYGNTPGKFTFQVDGYWFPYQGFEVSGWTPNGGEIAAETQSRRSQMPGNVSDSMGMFDAHIFINGSWQTFNGTKFLTDSALHAADGPYYGTSIWVWDKRCP